MPGSAHRCDCDACRQARTHLTTLTRLALMRLHGTMPTLCRTAAPAASADLSPQDFPMQ